MSSTDVLLNIATAAQLFHASDGTGFADLIIDGHRETWPLRGKRFQAWLRQHYYERTWDAPSPAAINAALNALEAQAQFDGPQRKVSLRLAEHDGLIYLDLADEFWRCIELGANRWRIADDPPVRFRPQRRHTRDRDCIRPRGAVRVASLEMDFDERDRI